jgi:hypothetical protein
MGRGPDDVLAESGGAALQERWDHAVPVATNGAAPAHQSAHRKPLRTVCIDGVAPEDVTWLWAGRIPVGKITILDGDPGDGKSTLTAYIAAAISTGAALPGGDARPPATVVMVSVEDGLGDTIRPRLSVAGADCKRIHCVPFDEPFRLPDDVPSLEATVRAHGAQLVIIDPLMAVLSSANNSHKDQDVRGALAPLAAMADATGCAVLIVRHLNKGQGAPALYRGGGSIGITGAARSVLLLAQDPDDASSRILARIKGNLAPPVPALRYRMVSCGAVARLEYVGETEHTPEQLLRRGDEARKDEDRSALEQAVDALSSILDGGKGVPATDVAQQAMAIGVSKATLRRACKALGVRTRRVGFGEGAKFIWSLPGQTKNE